MKTTNRKFMRLAGLGTINPANSFTLPTAEVDAVGVSVTSPGSKKAVTLELLYPAPRSKVGSRRAGHILLNGHQTREIYETLRAHYEASTEEE